MDLEVQGLDSWTPRRSPVGGRAGRHPSFWGLAGAVLLLAWALVALTGALAPAWDEPWLLRWVRALAAHPVRASLALGLALWAVRPGPRTHGNEGEAGQAFRKIL